MAEKQLSKDKCALGVLKEVERMLVKFRCDPSATLAPELVRIASLLQEAGHEIKTTEEEVLPDIGESQDFDALINELDAILGDDLDSEADVVLAEHLVDCLRHGDINSLIRRSDYLGFIFDSVEESTASVAVLSFLSVLYYLSNLQDRLKDGVIPLDLDDPEDDDDDVILESDEETDFELGDQLFPPES